MPRGPVGCSVAGPVGVAAFLALAFSFRSGVHDLALAAVVTVATAVAVCLAAAALGRALRRYRPPVTPPPRVRSQVTRSAGRVLPPAPPRPAGPCAEGCCRTADGLLAGRPVCRECALRLTGHPDQGTGDWLAGRAAEVDGAASATPATGELAGTTDMTEFERALRVPAPGEGGGPCPN